MVEMDFYELRSTSQNGWQNESGDLHGQEKQLRIGEEQVAVKWLPDIGSGPDVMQRFLQEINLLCHATLRCQRVCKVHGTCIKEERICIVMQLYKGSVAQLMAQQQGVPLPLEVALRWGIDAATALAELHREGVLVLDVK
eukprot:jgi/Astpho2/7730/Aster-07572